MKKKHGILLKTLILLVLLTVCVGLFLRYGYDKVEKAFYPTDYEEEVSKMAKETGLSKALIFAVIRTESGFEADAQSGAGAIGLMQLLPDSFDWIQRVEEGEELYSHDALFDPAVNIRYGCLTLKYMMDRFDGDEKAAIAAYNAGPGNVDRWLEDERYSSDGKTLSEIPFSETKHYVSKVLSAKEKYETLYQF